MALTVTTNVVTAIVYNSATGGGTVTGGTVTSRGVVWNTLPNPTTGNNKSKNGSGTGAFFGKEQIFSMEVLTQQCRLQRLKLK